MGVPQAFGNPRITGQLRSRAAFCLTNLLRLFVSRPTMISEVPLWNLYPFALCYPYRRPRHRGSTSVLLPRSEGSFKELVTCNPHVQPLCLPRRFRSKSNAMAVFVFMLVSVTVCKVRFSSMGTQALDPCLKSPHPKSYISKYSKKNVCFIMFLDEQTLLKLSIEGNVPDERVCIGLWRIVIVRNLPYKDMRKTGKRTGSEHAISNHYTRHCVWKEVHQNKRLNKYNHTTIDEQFNFYQSNGITKFDPSDLNTPLPSCAHVPEGSFIVRAHTPMSNLLSCLWFNEVNRFTSCDQLSFAYTFLKLKRLNSDRPFFLNMIWTYDPSTLASRNATIYCGAEIMSLEWDCKSDRLFLIGTTDGGIKAWNVDVKRVVYDLSTTEAFPRILDLKCNPLEPIFVSAEASRGSENVAQSFVSKPEMQKV
ncbi:hypothetical protein HYC85_020710 [Camellia sinensis]|uniref:TOD1/MUCI70 glycosyltransferase-like domain-containing protein n=1 Tax=Camellia sinensis TaxID=4442 RepID=A0A7J7GUG6_CAMSI|nr:hypothetical protein HYC85_020710 [Camellia sinensis]